MAQGEFTKEEAQTTIEAVTEIIEGLSKKKKIEFIGHFNDILLFLGAAKQAAPEETP